MNALSTYETLSLLVALLAVVVSFISLYRTSRISKRQLELQEAQARFTKFQHDTLAKEEAAKRHADVRMKMVGAKGDYRILLINLGPGIAKDVIFEEFVPDGQASPIIDSEKDSLLPIPQLLAGEEVSMLAAVHLGTALQFSARLSWYDADGQRHEQFSQVTPQAA